MVPQVIVDVRYHHIEHHPPVQTERVSFGVRSVLGQCVDDFRVAAGLAISRAGHRHGRQKRDPRRTRPIEPAGKQHGLAIGSRNVLVSRRQITSWSSSKGHLLPHFDTVLVGIPREFCDREATLSVDNRRLGPRTTERRTRGKYELQVVVGFLVPEDALTARHRCGKIDDGRDAGHFGCQILLARDRAKTEGAQTGRI